MGDFRIALSLPQTPVVENPLLLIVQNHHNGRLQRTGKGKQCSTNAGITLATTSETKLSHLHDNNQRAANVPAIDTFERYYFPYECICMDGLRMGARMGHMYKQVWVDLCVCIH